MEDYTRLHIQTALHHELLSPRQEYDLLCRAHQGDLDAKNELIRCNQRLVYSLARRYFQVGFGGDLEYLDLVQYGLLGLVEAIRRFDLNRSGRFSTYATWWIRAYIRRYATMRGSRVSISVRDADEGIPTIRRTRASLMQTMNREPTPQEIASHCGMSAAHVADLLKVIGGQCSVDDTCDETGIELRDLLPDPSTSPEELAVNASVKRDLAAAMRQHLTPIQQKVLTVRYGLDEQQTPHTLAETGQILGLSRERVRQIEAMAMSSLRTHFSLEYA